MDIFKGCMNDFLLDLMEQNFQVFRKENPEFKQEYENYGKSTERFYEYMKNFNEIDKQIIENYIEK